MPDERYFSIPSAEVGGDVRRNRALNCWPWGAIVDPFAGGRDPLAGGNGRDMANHGHDVTMPARPGAQNTKTILGVVVGYSLDEARQHFLGRWFRLRTHANCPGPTVPIKQTAVAAACSVAPLVMMCSCAQRCVQIFLDWGNMCDAPSHILPSLCGGRSGRDRRRRRLKLTISPIELMRAAQDA